MKTSDKGRGLNKKADGRPVAKFSSSATTAKRSNGTTGPAESHNERIEKTETMMGSTNSKKKGNESATTNGSPRKGSKQSPELRPRRRASQTYFFKYQLAKNPLKAEEDDLKMALLASLQQCNDGTIDNDNKNCATKPQAQDRKLKQQNKNSTHMSSEVRRPVGRPPKSCNDLTSVQNKIKKAKKMLQNKQANKTKGNAGIICRYSALRKFPSNPNSSLSAKVQGSSLLSPTKNTGKSNCKSKLNDSFQNNNDYNTPTAGANDYITPYSSYTPLQRKEPPDEDYMRKYKPETEDFLTFICFRTTAPNNQSRTAISDATAITNGIIETNHVATSNPITGNNRINEKQAPTDLNNLKQCNSTLSKFTSTNNSPINVEHCSPNNRRPTRQSPRLASSNRKISENDTSSSHTIGAIATACENSITYEEDMKRASIALEDMAQEIKSTDSMNNEVAQNSQDCISRLSSSPFKNNKHLVKGLMTREFAGAFADEETIFESISNHRL